MEYKIIRKSLLAFLLGFSPLSQAEYPAIQYDKAIKNKKNIDLAAVMKGTYTEIRWDKDNDGIIDSWSFSKGNVSVLQIFKNGKLVEVHVRKRAANVNTTLFYRPNGNISLNLVRAFVRPYRTYFSDSEAVPFDRIEEGPECIKTPISKHLSSTAMKNFVCKSGEAGLKEVVKDLIQDSCSENMNEVVNGLNTIYGLNLTGGYVEDNKALNCLAKSEYTSYLLPDYLQTISADLISEPKLKIACEQSPGPGCGKASYDARLRVLKLPITKPLCQKDMTEVFGKYIYHETIHRSVLDEMSEKSVEKIVDECMDADSLIASGSGQIRYEAAMAVPNYNHASPSEQARDIAATNTLAPPADTRSLAAQPGTLIATASSSDGALNSGFRSIASASQQAFNPNQAYRESVQRTAPSFAIFEAAVNKFVPSASAASSQWLNSSIQSSSSAGVAVQAPDLSASKRSPSSDSSASSAPNQKKGASQVTSREVANVKTGSTDSRATSGGSQSNLEFSSKGSASNHDETSAAPSAPALSPQQQKVVTEIVLAVNGAKSPIEAKALLKKNNGRLLGLKVHIYDPKAPKNENIYGLPSTDGAAKKFSLINGKLVPE